MAKELKNLTKRADNYSQWYNDLVVKADLAELSPVRGCMIIKPYGYAIWEKVSLRLFLPLWVVSSWKSMLSRAARSARVMSSLTLSATLSKH